MEFRLTYAGELRSGNRDRKRSLHVHAIREKFHEQLEKLWATHPILSRGHPMAPSIPNPEIESSFVVGDYLFKPIVTKDNGLICALDILMLREGPPGKVRVDLDNRLKTIFDALRMPQDKQELNEGTSKGKQTLGTGRKPFYVLLQDDHLITHVAVTSDMLLEPVERVKSSKSVRLVINVTVRPYNVTIHNVEFAGN